jgi:conjugative transposon TraM protein
MKDKQNSQVFKRRRKFMLMIPLLAVPFLVMFFWSLGGGKPDPLDKKNEIVAPGLNMKLPGAHLKDDKGLDKMSFYAEADKDSLKLLEKIKGDPYFKKLGFGSSTNSDSLTAEAMANRFTTGNSNQTAEFGKVGGISLNAHSDSNEIKVYQRLEALKKVMNSPGNSPSSPSYVNQSRGLSNANSVQTAEDNVEKLEKMMHLAQQSGQKDDPQVSKLNSMLDKIISIQHPDIMQDSLREKSIRSKGQVFPVDMQNTKADISIFGSKAVTRPPLVRSDSTNPSVPGDNGFLSIESDQEQRWQQNSIEAAVAETQTVVNGSTIKLRLLDKIFISGVEIPEGTFIFGTVNLSNERLKVAISSIGYRNSIFPVNLEVFDRSGMSGIYIPGAITRDVSKQSADEAISGLSLTSLDPSITAQATSAGIQAAKSLLSKKIKLVRVTVKGNYEILLKNGG